MTSIIRQPIPQLPELDTNRPLAPAYFQILPYVFILSSLLFLPIQLRRYIGLPVTIAVTIYPLVYLRQPDAVTAYLIGNAQIYATILAGSLLTVEIEKTLVKLDKEGNEKAAPVGLWDRFRFYADLLSNPRGIHWKWSRTIDKQGIQAESTKTKWIFIRDRLPALLIYIFVLDAFETYLHTPPYDILTIRPISAQPATMQVFHLIFFALVAMSAISISNILASIVTVAIGLSKPKDWPRFFNMKESWSIARLWSVGWHSVFKKTITFYGNAISSVFPKFAQMPIKVLIGFSLTGLSHAMGAYIMAGLGKGQFYFFVIQTVGIVVEYVLLGNTFVGEPPSTGRKWFGYLYTAGFVGITSRPFLDEFIVSGLCTDDIIPISITRGILTGQWRV